MVVMATAAIDRLALAKLCLEIDTTPNTSVRIPSGVSCMHSCPPFIALPTYILDTRNRGVGFENSRIPASPLRLSDYFCSVSLPGSREQKMSLTRSRSFIKLNLKPRGWILRRPRSVTHNARPTIVYTQTSSSSSDPTCSGYNASSRPAQRTYAYILPTDRPTSSAVAIETALRGDSMYGWT